MSEETASNDNSKGEKANSNKAVKPEELILRPGKGSLAFADSLDLPYDLQNTAEELYGDIRQNSTSLAVYGDNYWVEEFAYDPAGNVTQWSKGDRLELFPY